MMRYRSEGRNIGDASNPKYMSVNRHAYPDDLVRLIKEPRKYPKGLFEVGDVFTVTATSSRGMVLPRIRGGNPRSFYHDEYEVVEPATEKLINEQLFKVHYGDKAKALYDGWFGHILRGEIGKVLGVSMLYEVPTPSYYIGIETNDGKIDYVRPEELMILERRANIWVRYSVGDRLVLRGDLIDGEIYGGIHYLEEEVGKPGSIVSVVGVLGARTDFISYRTDHGNSSYVTSSMVNHKETEVLLANGGKIKKDKLYSVGDKVSLKDEDDVLGGGLVEISYVNPATSIYRSEQSISGFFTNDDINHEKVEYKEEKDGMRAKFIGRDGSMGFKHGEVYNIETYINSRLFRRDGLLWLRDKDSGLKCPYINIESLLNNWELLKEG